MFTPLRSRQRRGDDPGEEDLRTFTPVLEVYGPREPDMGTGSETNQTLAAAGPIRSS